MLLTLNTREDASVRACIDPGEHSRASWPFLRIKLECAEIDVMEKGAESIE